MGWSNDFPTLFKRDVERELVAKLVEIEEYCYEQAYRRSPVLSGTYRANHNRSRGKPDFSFDWSKESGKARAPSGVKPFDVLYIANGAPYARRIEFHGWSHKASGGVYQVAIQSARAKFR